MLLSDFPKIECPFTRKRFPVDKDDWKHHGRALQMREPYVYLVQPEISQAYEWVFEDKDVMAAEKLDGTNIKVLIENGRLAAIQNRLNVMNYTSLDDIKGNFHILEGVLQSLCKGYVGEGEHAGELIGPKLQGNPYRITSHIWMPFERIRSTLEYKSFHQHERTFENFSSWFKDYLFSLYHQKIHGNKEVMAEGVVFYSKQRDLEGKVCMAKLRRDMFDWHYTGNVRILY